jgi:hypothetical protein
MDEYRWRGKGCPRHVLKQVGDMCKWKKGKDQTQQGITTSRKEERRWRDG